MTTVFALAIPAGYFLSPTVQPVAAAPMGTKTLTTTISTANDVPVFATNLSKTMPMNVDFKYLNNAKVGGLAATMLGHKPKDDKGNIIPLPDNAEVNFVQNLRVLWDRKLAIKGVSGATQKNADYIVHRYQEGNPDIKGIKTFVTEINTQAQFAHSNIDFVSLCDKLNVDDFQCYVLRDVTGRIKGRQLAAYGMTEIMPSFNGKFNYVMLDTLLRNAGESYIQSIPALGDKLLSLGFYQFTSYAIYSVNSNEGASMVNRFVVDPAAKIPGSVVSLQGAEHHRAAFYFVTYNMARLMKKLNKKDAQLLESGACQTTDLTQFMATAHHMPSEAIKRAKNWIKAGCKKPIVDYMGPHLREYASKTKNNLEALEEKL
jgi:hypothetical protein